MYRSWVPSPDRTSTSDWTLWTIFSTSKTFVRPYTSLLTVPDSRTRVVRNPNLSSVPRFFFSNFFSQTSILFINLSNHQSSNPFFHTILHPPLTETDVDLLTYLEIPDTSRIPKIPYYNPKTRTNLSLPSVQTDESHKKLSVSPLCPISIFLLL